MPKPWFYQQIQVMFNGVQNLPVDAWPERGALSSSLNNIATDSKDDYARNVNQDIVNFFAKSSIEMWHRSIHSFLISSSLTEASPIWASVSGYYSSHYSIRAFAHALGYFHLHRKKKIVRLEIVNGNYICYFEKKDGSDREHKCYWKKVKEQPLFENDDFFTVNKEDRGSYDTPSDVMHRDRANYWDLINIFPTFNILDKEFMKQRVKKLAGISLIAAPIPISGNFPDVYNVQLIAYHRMIRFRKFLDEIIGSNRFWIKHRNPSWCTEYLNFQITNPESLTLINELKNEL